MNDELLEIIGDVADSFSRIASALEEQNALEKNRILLEHGDENASPEEL